MEVGTGFEKGKVRVERQKEKDKSRKTKGERQKEKDKRRKTKGVTKAEVTK